MARPTLSLRVVRFFMIRRESGVVRTVMDGDRVMAEGQPTSDKAGLNRTGQGKTQRDAGISSYFRNIK
jgi:hypothetical protein